MTFKDTHYAEQQALLKELYMFFRGPSTDPIRQFVSIGLEAALC